MPESSRRAFTLRALFFLRACPPGTGLALAGLCAIFLNQRLR